LGAGPSFLCRFPEQIPFFCHSTSIVRLAFARNVITEVRSLSVQQRTTDGNKQDR
jgi:hypothetical protein